MSQSRQLAAIMFTDIVGYTKLMGESELQAFTLLEKSRNIQRPLVEQYHGKWLKEMGDGALASFSSVSDAVYCAKAIQQACLNEPDLSLRIGVHLGEVVFEGDDVFGDGVNIASRLEPLAPPGGIIISEAVQRNIQNKEDLSSQYTGEHNLKNVQHPVRTYQVDVATADRSLDLDSGKIRDRPGILNRMPLLVVGMIAIAAAVYFVYPKGQTAESEITSSGATLDKSIAVLPFVNMSNDPDQEYFSDGMTEEVLNHLVKVGELKVTSRTSTMQYKGTQKSVKQIANELGVAHILEGSVRKAGEQVRITVQLIDAETDQHLWSETYDRELVQIFEIQSNVAQQVASALNAQLSPDIIQSMEQVPTANMEAYDLYLKALSKWDEFSDYSLIAEYLKEAIRLDSTFSSAYAMLGNVIIFRGGFHGNQNPSDLADSGKTMLEKALLLNPSDGTAHNQMSFFYLWYDKDFVQAEIALQAASAFSPSSVNVYRSKINFLLASGKFEDAIAAGHSLLRLSKHGVNRAMNALIWAFNDEPDSSRYYQDQVSPAEFQNVLTATEIARSNVILKDYQSALKVLSYSENVRSLPRSMAFLSISHQQLGNKNESDQWLARLEERNKESAGGSPAFYLAMVYAMRGETDQAFEWLAQSFATNEIELYWLKVEPMLSPLYSDPRWKEMLARIEFP